jgi:hypothetical protein
VFSDEQAVRTVVFLPGPRRLTLTGPPCRRRVLPDQRPMDYGAPASGRPRAQAPRRAVQADMIFCQQWSSEVGHCNGRSTTQPDPLTSLGLPAAVTTESVSP